MRYIRGMTETSTTSRGYNFPIARRVWRFAKKRWQKWRARHQLPLNLYLHMVGIPLAMTGVVLWFYEDWMWGTICFVLGYLLQYLGHRAEGNDVGELVPFKRLLGLPYITVAPRWQRADTPT